MKLNEKTLPYAIAHDITQLKDWHLGKNDLPQDCLWCELYGSINGSQHGGEITKEVADYLRAKYLGLENGVDVEYYFWQPNNSIRVE